MKTNLITEGTFESSKVILRKNMQNRKKILSHILKLFKIKSNGETKEN